jgi:hypothetical protein
MTPTDETTFITLWPRGLKTARRTHDQDDV